VVLADLGGRPYFGLPGNPVSSMISFLLFVRPAIRAALGCDPPFDLPTANVVLDEPVRARGDRRAYLRARLRFQDGQLRARPMAMARQGSSVLSSMLGANGLIVVEPGGADLAAGSKVAALVIGPLA
jgi:molybdopterin molybdotransferase